MALILGGIGAFQAGVRLLPRHEQLLARSPLLSAVIDDPGSPFSGPVDSAITLVIFTDYRCPVCRRSHDHIQRVLATAPDVKVLYKDWPILGEGSVRAARAALAADRQARYAAMHDALMRAPARLDDQAIDAAARQAGVDPVRLRRDLVDHAEAITQRLEKNGAQAWSLGLRGTPAFLAGRYFVAGAIDARRLQALLAMVRNTALPR